MKVKRPQEIECFRLQVSGGHHLLCGWSPARGPGAGSGPIADGFLVVQGFWGDFRREAFLGLAEALSAFGPVLLANLRGHPGSSGWFSFGREEPDDMGPLLEEMARRGVPRVTAVGFSLGGWCLAAHLARHPGRGEAVRHLVMVSVPSRLPRLLPRPWLRGLWVQLAEGGKGWIRPNPLSLWPPRDLAPLLPGLSPLPVTVIHAEEDWMVHPGHGDRNFEALENPKRFVRIPDRRGLHAEMLALYHAEALVEAIRDPPGSGLGC